MSIEDEDVKLNIEEILPIATGLNNRFLTPSSIVDDDKFYTGSVKIDVTDPLAEIFSTKTVTATASGLLNLSAGLTFSTNASNNTVKIYNAFGSATHNDPYYVVSKKFSDVILEVVKDRL